MYTHFFGLNEKPFSITPDPRYLYLSARHGEALAHLLYGVTESGGFIQLTGEVGTGKTTLVRSLLEQLPSYARVALILNPRVSPTEFLQIICDELRTDPPTDRASPKALVDTLNNHLLDAHSRGERVVLIVDEAQNLSADVLEQVRLLTNLETAKQKLLQIILIGQPELREVLDRTDLRQLAQRITGRYHLEPLLRDESITYIRHRLQVAGATGEIFRPGALAEVHRLSGGIPRIMNVISDRALLGAYATEQHTVSARLVRRAAAEVYGRSFHPRWVKRIAWGAGAAFGLLLAVGVWKMAADLREERPSPQNPTNTTTTESVTAAPVTTTGNPVAAALAEPLVEPELAAPAPSLDNLDELLAQYGLETGTDGAFRGLFTLWGNDYQPTGQPPCEYGREAGLQCIFRTGSWGQLRRFNRPAILSLTDDDGVGHQVVLASLTSDIAHLEFAGERYRVSMSSLSNYWFGDFLILWRPQAGQGGIIAEGMNGPSVLWLRQSLESVLGDLPVSATPEYFDRELTNAVRRFQRRHALKIDGIVGAQTQITLNSAVRAPGTPLLLEES